MTKAQLRQHFLAQRQALTEAEVALRSKAMCDRLFTAFDFSFRKVVHTFLPMEKQREPDTWLVVDRLRREFPHVRIVLPKVEPGDQLVHLEFEGLHQLKKNKWGISEPQQGTKIDPKQIDLVMVPLLAADRHGHRLGYGKGFYDRFLSDTRPDCLRVGYSLLPPFDDRLPNDPWDVKLTHLLTPEALVSF